MKKIFAYIVLCITLASCVFPFEATLDGTTEDVITFEGRIVVGGVSTIRFSKVYTSEDNDFVTIEGTAVIEDENGKEYKSSQAVPSSYLEIPMEDADPDLKYRMKAEVNGKTYVSDWLDSLEPPIIKNVSISPDDTDVNVILEMDSGKDATGYIGVAYNETWEFHTEFKSLYYAEKISMSKIEYRLRPEEYENYWCWRIVSHPGTTLVDYADTWKDGSGEFRLQSFPRSNERNHKKYCIEIKAVTLTEPAYIFLKNLQKISEGDRSLFSPNPGEVSSNVFCESDPDQKVTGYVIASQVASTRVFMDSRFYKPEAPSIVSLFLPNPREPNTREISVDFQRENLPVDSLSLPKGNYGRFISAFYWAPLRCVDCIVAGGTKEKPDYWDD